MCASAVTRAELTTALPRDHMPADHSSGGVLPLRMKDVRSQQDEDGQGHRQSNAHERGARGEPQELRQQGGGDRCGRVLHDARFRRTE